MNQPFSSARVGVFVAGVQKGATTTLFAYLAAHPEMAPPAQKEPHFFDDESRDWARPDYAPYHALFGGAGLGFDATPIHGFWPGALPRICAYNPAARLIWIFRDPVARAFSHWRMERARGWEDLPFAEAIRGGRARAGGAPHRVYSYVERGFYGAQVARALKLFARDQMLFLTTDALEADPRGVLARLSGFLGVAPFSPQPALREHIGPPAAEAPTASDRALLWAEWAEDAALFQRLTGIDPAMWR